MATGESMAATANVTPAQALARFLIAALAAAVMILVLLVGMVGVGDPVETSGATTTAAAVGGG